MPAPHLARPPDLPPGLSPVTAGRLGLWLLGKRQHNRALKRTVFPKGAIGYGLVNHMVNLLSAWTVEEYPGYRRLLAEWAGVAIKTSDRWLYGCDRLPRRHALRFASLCRERGSALLRLGDEFEAWADRPAEASKRVKREDRGG